MTSNQFFIERVEKHALRLILRGREHHHLSRVARKKAGDIVWMVDAAGRRFRTRIMRTGGEETLLEILEKTESPTPSVHVTLAPGLLQYRIMETILQKAAEFGVAEFIPVCSNRSLPLLEDRMRRRLERWKNIARDAVKQSKGFRAPEIREAMSLKEFLRREETGRKFAFTERPARLLRDALHDHSRGYSWDRPQFVTLLVGPEGGWTKKEEDDIIKHGYETVSLGPFILRAETAAVAAVACLMHFWGGD